MLRGEERAVEVERPLGALPRDPEQRVRRARRSYGGAAGARRRAQDGPSASVGPRARISFVVDASLSASLRAAGGGRRAAFGWPGFWRRRGVAALQAPTRRLGLNPCLRHGGASHDAFFRWHQASRPTARGSLGDPLQKPWKACAAVAAPCHGAAEQGCPPFAPQRSKRLLPHLCGEA